MKRPSRKKRRGSAALEFAVVVPLLFALLLAVWDFGKLIDAQQLLTNAAREGARQASTGQCTPSQVQESVTNHLQRGGVNTSGLSVQVTNLTSPGLTDPSDANRLDQLKVVVSLPSANVRLIALGGLPGRNTLQASAIWSSMRDSPIILPPGIPQY